MKARLAQQKVCHYCTKEFPRRSGITDASWKAQQYCCRECAGAAKRKQDWRILEPRKLLQLRMQGELKNETNEGKQS